MNMSPHTMTLVLAFCFFTITGFAQSSSNNAMAASAKYSSALAFHSTKNTTKKYSPYRFHKRLSGTHSGYVIELAASNLPLERTASIFRQFGNVYYDKLEEGYSYVIHTNFTKQASLEKFFNQIIKPKTPEARMIEYKEGKRIILPSK